MVRRETRDRNAARFGAIVRRLREDRRWTLAECGRRADVNQRYLSTLEYGENIPTLTIILKLARAFKVPAADIIRELEQWNAGAGSSPADGG